MKCLEGQTATVELSQKAVSSLKMDLALKNDESAFYQHPCKLQLKATVHAASYQGSDGNPTLNDSSISQLYR